MVGNDRNEYFWRYSVLRTFLIKEIASFPFLARKLYHTLFLPLKGDVDKAYDVAVQPPLCRHKSSDLNSEAQVYVLSRMPAGAHPSFREVRRGQPRSSRQYPIARKLWFYFLRSVGTGKRDLQKHDRLFRTHIFDADWTVRQPRRHGDTTRFC